MELLKITQNYLPNALDFKMIWPQIAIAVFLVALLLLDLIGKRGETVFSAFFAIFGLIIAAAFSYKLRGSTPTEIFKNTLFYSGLLNIDNFSIYFNIVFCIGAILTILISIKALKREGYNYSEYYVLILGATFGMMIMASANDLLTVFLGIEVLSISLYILAGFARKRVESNEASIKYLLLGSFATGFLLYGTALIYGATGTTNLKEINDYVIVHHQQPLLLIGMFLLLVGLMFKASLAPFHQWAPDVYQGAPTPVTAFMSTGAKAAAFAVLIRVLTFAFPGLHQSWTPILYFVAILTMIIGNFTAIAQTNIKRMLAYSSISHAGYIVIAIIANNAEGSKAILFYLLSYTLMNLGAFGVLVAIRRADQANETLESFAGLANRYPFLAAMMAIFMFSLAGIPPTAGFIGKFMIFKSALVAGYIPLVIIGVLNAVVSVYYYLRVVVVMYMKEPEIEIAPDTAGIFTTVSLIISAVAVLLIGIIPMRIITFVQDCILYTYHLR